jgi:hypothetical protein
MAGKMTSDPLYIALTFDAELDVFDSSFRGGESLSLRGIEEGIPIIDGILAQHRDSSGARACATWCVRCDDHIQALTGEHAYLLKHYRDCWQHHLDAGDEIGFHPHLYKQTENGWVQETDAGALTSQIHRAHAAMEGAGFKSHVSRIGEAFSSNAVMQTLDDLGIICDSTAMPGRVRRDDTRQLDWSGTPDHPYHPSLTDYRLPGADAHALLEAPMTLVPTLAAYDREPLRRYIDLSFHHQALRDGLSAFIPEAHIIVTVTHPSTILPGITKHPHGLLSFDASNFAKNLEYLTQECSRLGRSFRFITLRHCTQFLQP